MSRVLYVYRGRDCAPPPQGITNTGTCSAKLPETNGKGPTEKLIKLLST